MPTPIINTYNGWTLITGLDNESKPTRYGQAKRKMPIPDLTGCKFLLAAYPFTDSSGTYTLIDYIQKDGYLEELILYN